MFRKLLCALSFHDEEYLEQIKVTLSKRGPFDPKERFDTMNVWICVHCGNKSFNSTDYC